MNRTASILFFVILFASTIFSQEALEPYTPVIYHQQGLDYLGEDPDYEKAEQEFAKIHPNDTLYSQSFYNRIFCLRSSEKYEEALTLIDQAITDKNEYIIDIYVNKVKCLEALGKQDSVYAVLDRAETSYPYNYNLKNLRGQMLEKEGRYKEALEIYKQCILDEPKNPVNHYSLANLALKAGAVAHAVLPIATALALAPEREGNLGVLSQVNRVVSSKPEVEYPSLDHAIFGEDFEDINDLVSNYVALDDGYIVPGYFQIYFIKQLHLIIAESELTDGFFSEMYLKPFKKILDTGKYSSLSSLICFSSKDEDHKKILTKNLESLISFNADFENLMDDSSEKRDPIEGLTDKKVDYLYNSEGSLSGMCEYDEKRDLLIGPAVYFNSLGSIEYRGAYDKDGYATGKWMWYHNNGILARESNYVNGKLNGLSRYYTERGVLSTTANFKDDKLEGRLENYKLIGYKYEDVDYQNGEMHGDMTGYYPDNAIYYKYKLQSGKYNGPFTIYFDDGSIEVEGSFKNDLYQGEVKRYFRNGQISYLENYQDGILHGIYESYYQDGQIQSVGKLKNGEKIGEWKEFSAAGALIQIEEFDEKGKVNGPTKNFDHLGRIETVYNKKKGSIVELINYDKDGNVISSFKRKGNELDFKNLKVNGQLSSEGLFKDDVREELWKFYDIYGNLNQESPYEQGKLEGTVKAYFSNGALSSEINYQDNMKNGLYVEYFLSGKVKYQAYYKDDKLEGRSIYYNQVSNITSDLYYINGLQEGANKYYNSDGSIYLIEDYDSGYLMEVTRYAPDGQIRNKTAFENGDGIDEYHYTAERKTLMGKQEYVGGNKNGALERFHINGSPRTQGHYVNDNRNGEWNKFYYNGNKSLKGNYEYGTPTGAWEEYFVDGTISDKYEYAYGRYNGDYNVYHDNGKLKLKIRYVNGVIDGTCDIYNYDEELVISLIYENNVLTGYTYLDQNNQPKEIIPIVKGTSSVEAYFPNGTKSINYKLESGFINGLYQVYYSNGTLASETDYAESMFDGKRTRYYNDGMVHSVLEYMEDAKHNEHTYYYPNGQIKRVENWIAGEQHGNTIHYDDNGTIIQTIRYVGDVPHEIN